MIEWKSENNPVAYDFAVETMEKRVADIRSGNAPELVWLLEHPPLYTAGTSAKEGDLLSTQFPVFKTGRGGEYTYHGPGQRVAYVMLDLKKHQGNMPDVRAYVCALEGWIIRTLGAIDVKGERRAGRIGIWVDMSSYNANPLRLPLPEGEGRGEGVRYSIVSRESKIAAIGIRIRHWVTYHGIAINVNPDLSHFNGIVPCGIREHGVTSLHDLGKAISMDRLDIKLKENFPDNFKLSTAPDRCTPDRP